jgi:hypothetical protein
LHLSNVQRRDSLGSGRAKNDGQDRRSVMVAEALPID